MFSAAYLIQPSARQTTIRQALSTVCPTNIEFNRLPDKHIIQPSARHKYNSTVCPTTKNNLPDIHVSPSTVANTKTILSAANISQPSHLSTLCCLRLFDHPCDDRGHGVVVLFSQINRHGEARHSCFCPLELLGEVLFEAEYDDACGQVLPNVFTYVFIICCWLSKWSPSIVAA